MTVKSIPPFLLMSLLCACAPPTHQQTVSGEPAASTVTNLLAAPSDVLRQFRAVGYTTTELNQTNSPAPGYFAGTEMRPFRGRPIEELSPFVDAIPNNSQAYLLATAPDATQEIGFTLNVNEPSNGAVDDESFADLVVGFLASVGVTDTSEVHAAILAHKTKRIELNAAAAIVSSEQMTGPTAVTGAYWTTVRIVGHGQQATQ